ncbi:MAG TPA: DNA polymerase III subunit delta' [Candidatus Hydrogenedentes bacterium]|nr:DNA polymerase III subunit delta' [Candidatus Hydrogenedentota bacterium]
MSFNRIKDQHVAIKLLRGIVCADRVPSGLLFCGPYGVGKRATALEFAKAVNCRDSKDDACDECLSCRKTMHGNHADVIVVRPVSKSRVIKVENIEDVIERTMFRPFEGGRRVCVIEDADRMNEAAQNHFLKTLEEPPSQTVFVLLTEWPRLLLPTIRSRCQSIRFGALKLGTVADIIIRENEFTEEQAYAIAALSRGSISRARDLVKKERRAVVLDMVHRLALGEDPLLVSEAFAAHIQDTEKAIEQAVKKEARQEADNDPAGESGPDTEAIESLVAGLVRGELFEYLVLFDAWYRDELVFGVSRDTQLVYNRDYLQKFKTDINVDKHAAKLDGIRETWKYIERNLNSQRVFRDLFFLLAS